MVRGVDIFFVIIFVLFGALTGYFETPTIMCLVPPCPDFTIEYVLRYSFYGLIFGIVVTIIRNKFFQK